ncbi:MAG: sulfurtransferase TusA family protein [Pseudomonadota bacterium]
MPEITETADLRGYRCPLPVLKLRARMKKLPVGAVVEVLTDDPLAALDIPALCQEVGHGLLEQNVVDGDEMRFLVERGV